MNSVLAKCDADHKVCIEYNGEAWCNNSNSCLLLEEPIKFMDNGKQRQLERKSVSMCNGISSDSKYRFEYDKCASDVKKKIDFKLYPSEYNEAIKKCKNTNFFTNCVNVKYQSPCNNTEGQMLYRTYQECVMAKGLDYCNKSCRDTKKNIYPPLENKYIVRDISENFTNVKASQNNILIV